MKLPACNALFTRKLMMFWFCSLMALNYMDRGAFASNGVNGTYDDLDCSKECDDRFTKECRDLCGFTGMQGEFNLTNEQVGLLASLFTAGLTVASPLSAHAVRHAHPFLVIGIGQLVFCIGILLCGFASSYGQLLGFRTLVGVSEPSFMVVAPAVIDRLAPRETRSTWLAVFMMCVSIGTAGGLILGYIVTAADLDWRWSFRIQAALNVPYVALFLFARPTTIDMDFSEQHDDLEKSKLLASMKSVDGEQNPLSPVKPEQHERKNASLLKVFSLFASDAGRLLSMRRYVLLVFAFIFMNILGGVILFWGTKAAQQRFNLDHADTYFGGIVIIGGIAGTLLGGWVLDKIGSGFVNAARVCGSAMALSGVFLTAMWWIPPNDPSPVGFFCCLSVGYVIMAAYYSPAISTLLWVADKNLRPQSIALCNLLYHVFGDVPSPWYAGAIQDTLSDWPVTFTIMTSSVFLSAFFFGLASITKGEEYCALDRGGA